MSTPARKVRCSHTNFSARKVRLTHGYIVHSSNIDSRIGGCNMCSVRRCQQRAGQDQYWPSVHYLAGATPAHLVSYSGTRHDVQIMGHFSRFCLGVCGAHAWPFGICYKLSFVWHHLLCLHHPSFPAAFAFLLLCQPPFRPVAASHA